MMSLAGSGLVSRGGRNFPFSLRSQAGRASGRPDSAKDKNP
jgi:hypothetical protein